jgi:alpha-galactosidase
MSILYDAGSKIFHLCTINASYVFEVVKGHYLVHLYWGRRIREAELSYVVVPKRRLFSPSIDPQDKQLSLNTLLQEYPGYGQGDFRTPSFHVLQENGSTVMDLCYVGHRIDSGKPVLKGLPATYVHDKKEADTLEIELVDELTQLSVYLSYTVFRTTDAITRSVRFENNGQHCLSLQKVSSMCVDFDNAEYDLLHLPGGWARERYVERTSLFTGRQAIESCRGASSHEHNPFIALLGKHTNEAKGDAYGFSFVYSGNFLAETEISEYKTTRVCLGINPFDFSWLLEPGETFQTPEVVLVYSDCGIGGMSRVFHALYRKNLCHGIYQDAERPVLINNWEATRFDFTEEKVIEIAKKAKDCGIELFALDDGWFGKRDSDDTSLGDWHADTRKLPDGLEGLGNKLSEIDMGFGLWIEPEMVSPDSKLYREHPDWCLHVPHRPRTQCRNQLILDISRDDVCKAIVSRFCEIFSSVPVRYVKWDMNRNMTEIGSSALPPKRQRETAHRYILGLYRIMEELTAKYPEILFEGCSGGGGRFDPGILFYMPQIWTSDDTDAIERAKIQFGTSIVYPVSAMANHVSSVPNHQVGRTTPLKTRGDVACSGVLGYELDLTQSSNEELQAIRRQIDRYKEVRHIILWGNMFRLKDPFHGDASWMFVTEDRCEAFVLYIKNLAIPYEPSSRLKLTGLDPDKRYEVNGSFRLNGDTAMNVGLVLPLLGDFESFTWYLKAV